MFNLFKKKSAGAKVTDKIVISEAAKWNAILAHWSVNKNSAIVCWFDDTIKQAETFFALHSIDTPAVLSARQASSQPSGNSHFIFAEHYPLRQKEESLFEKLKLDSVIVYSALEEPLFKKFGSDKIIHLMKQMGLKEEEVIEHKMITKSILTAQEKIEKKVTFEREASSQGSWLEINLA